MSNDRFVTFYSCQRKKIFTLSDDKSEHPLISSKRHSKYLSLGTHLGLAREKIWYLAN